MLSKTRFRKLISAAMAVLLLLPVLAACKQPPKSESEPPGTENTLPMQDSAEPEITTPLASAPEGENDTEPPTLPPVEVAMPAYTLTYSGEMAEIISYEEAEDETGLRFFVTLSTGKAPLFTLQLNRIAGELVVMKKNAAGEEIPVTFLMEAIPENLSQEDETTFCLAQETVNDIIASLILK